MALQFDREKEPKQKEVVLSALSAFLKGNSFIGKRQYIQQMKGIEQLLENICKEGTDKKTKLKLIQLLNDLVVNDDSI